jgi:hypothetical protein
MVPIQKQHDCWWFGEPGECHNFYILIVAVSILAVTDIVFTVVMIWSGGTSAGTSDSNTDNRQDSISGERRKYRCAVAAGFTFTEALA